MEIIITDNTNTKFKLLGGTRDNDLNTQPL